MEKVLSVLVMDDDYYARQALVSYLAWDRRTRVITSVDSYSDLLSILETMSKDREIPNVLVLDVESLNEERDLGTLLDKILSIIDTINIVCLSQTGDLNLVNCAIAHGAKAFLLKDEIRLGIASAIVHACLDEFLVTENIFESMIENKFILPVNIKILPGPKRYPELTTRMEQAVKYFAIEGMSADLIADEMSISTTTVRTYLRQAIAIMRAFDERIYTVGLNNREILFHQYTLLDDIT